MSDTSTYPDYDLLESIHYLKRDRRGGLIEKVPIDLLTHSASCLTAMANSQRTRSMPTRR